MKLYASEHLHVASARIIWTIGFFQSSFLDHRRKTSYKRRLRFWKWLVLSQRCLKSSEWVFRKRRIRLNVLLFGKPHTPCHKEKVAVQDLGVRISYLRFRLHNCILFFGYFRMLFSPTSVFLFPGPLLFQITDRYQRRLTSEYNCHFSGSHLS